MNVLELFSGAGGLALGFEQSGLHCLAVNDNDKQCIATLKSNRPNWYVLGGDVRELDVAPFRGVRVVSGGFPCQPFSYAGKKMGLNDVRGTLFYSFASTVKFLQPDIFVAENVKGITTHDKGKTLRVILSILGEIGYNVTFKILRATDYGVPQNRQRLFIVGVRSDIDIDFEFPKPITTRQFTLRDALKSGILYDQDAPISNGDKYSERKKKILDLVPPGGCWRDLPESIQRDYMGNMWFMGGGRTGIAKRLSWDLPSPTLTCSPSQKMTERCHPEETRPLTVREYARIQTFPDEWVFSGSLSAQYKQIGNAVPVLMAKALGGSIVAFLNEVNSSLKNPVIR